MNVQYEQLIDGILARGYGVIDDFLTPDNVARLASQLHQRQQAGQLRAAGVGAGQATVERSIRGDEIFWLGGPDATADEQAFLGRINDLIQYLNETCYLGLHDAELHYARYPAGAFYQRHLDRFRADSRRKLSVICYLNQDWREEDGGQLALFLPQEDRSERTETLLPLGGRLVCFESDKLEHEVRPARRERLSLTGWLRRE